MMLFMLDLALKNFRENFHGNIGSLEPGTYSYIEVENTGKKISVENLKEIFNPFFSTKSDSKSSGSGLGLSVVAQVTNDHDGAVDVQTSSSGTCFTIYLPSIEPPAYNQQTNQKNEKQSIPYYGEETILIVENDKPLLKELEESMKNAGYSVITSHDGKSAIEILQLQQVDLLLFELDLPGMRGADILHGAIHLRPGIRGIVHSKFISNQDMDQLNELDIKAVLPKPASKAQILRTIRRVLNEHPSK